MILLVSADRKGSGGIKKTAHLSTLNSLSNKRGWVDFLRTLPTAQLRKSTAVLLIYWSFFSAFCQLTICADPGWATEPTVSDSFCIYSSCEVDPDSGHQTN